MERIKRAIYIGGDDAYLSEVQSTFSHENEIFYYIQSIDSPMSFVTAVLEVIPNTIFLDVSEIVNNPDEAERFLYVMRMLKSSKSIGSCLFVAIFDSKRQREEYSYLFSLGFNVGVIKSDDLSAYNDFSYIIGSPNFVFTPYATARFDLIKYMAAIQLDVSAVSEGYLQISSDIELEEWEEEIKFKLFEDYNVTYYDQIKLEGNCHQSDYMYHYALLFPYAGPHDEVDQDSLFPEMIETWLDLNRGRMQVQNCSVMILSVDISYVITAHQISDQYGMDVYYFRQVDEDDNPIIDILPDIIIVDMKEMEESGTSVKKIVEVIESVEAYQPMVITFGNLSTSEATQKAFSYFNMLAVKNDINPKLIDQLISVYKNSERSSECEEVVRFKLSDKRRVGKLDTPLEITSISEQFITFASKIEIPFFTNVFFKQPCNIMAIIVPAFKDLEALPGRRHYMALIHSYTHEDKQILRRFVNQCIFNPPEVFEYVEVELEKEEGYFIKPVTEEEKKKEETKAESASRRFDANKIDVGGKSKL